MSLRGFLRNTASCLIALATLASAADASAFCRTMSQRCSPSSCPESNPECCTDVNGCGTRGAKVFWPTSCITYNFNVKGSNILDRTRARVMVAEAFEAWSLVDCGGGKIASMSISPGEDVPCEIAQHNKDGPNVNLIVFRDDRWDHFEPGPIAPDTLAKTTVTFSSTTGEIFDADIEVNSVLNELSTTDPPAEVAYDLQAIMTHEVGHFIGIAHSSDSSAVMSPTYSRGSIAQRQLTPDDVAALCDAYPPDRAVACNTIPRGGLSRTCTAASSEEDKSGCAMTTTDSPASAFANLSGFGLIGLLVASRRAKRRCSS